MSIWVGLLILVLSITDDILAVFYIRRVNGGSVMSAAILSGALTGLVSLEVYLYAPHPAYIPFNAIGSCIGTPFALWLDSRLPKVKPRDKKGRFKPTPAPAEFQRRSELP